MIDLNSKRHLSARINRRIDEALEAKNKKQKPRNYLGGSRVGVECERALQFEYFNTTKDEGKDFPGRVLRIFERGFWVEDAMINWIRMAGFDLQDRDSHSGRQFGFSIMDDRVQGHCDGVVFSGPVLQGWPRLWECKGIQKKDWTALEKKGLREKYPVYYAQCQYYMKHFELTKYPALFSAVCMDNMEIYWEEVRYNKTFADSLDSKAKRILLACVHGELLPKLRNDPSYYLCNWCSWNKRCYSL